MSVTETDIIDAMAENDRELVLLLADQLTWAAAQKEHLSVLQKKLNTYIRFISDRGWERKFGSREYDSYKIEIVFRYQYPEYFRDFIGSAYAELKKRNIRIEYRVYSGE